MQAIIERPQTFVARSAVGQRACFVNLTDRDAFIILRAYLDGSGKLGTKYLTLAAFAGTDETWSEFETQWKNILDSHTPKGSYIHMREIVRLIKGFDSNLGWTHDNAFGLVNKCLMYMSNLDKQRFKMFYCAVDLEAWQRLKAETYEIPAPIELCNKFCTETIFGWMLLDYPAVIDTSTDRLHYFFDRNEYFKAPFEEMWNREKDKFEEQGIQSVWAMIKEVSAVDMKDVPGIQAADIIAWAVNREQNQTEGPGRFLAHIMRQIIPTRYIVWNEEYLRKHFKPVIHRPY